MDPLTMSLIGLGIGGIQGGIQSLGNNAVQKRNRSELEDLLDLEKRGDLGLPGAEQRELTSAFVTPVQQAASQTRGQAEQAMASQGLGNGADLARLRTEQTRAVSEGAQKAAQQIAAVDRAVADQQKNQIEQRTGLKSALFRDDINSVSNAISQAAGPVGAALGAPPGTFSLNGLAGAPQAQTQTQAVQAYAKEFPLEFEKMLQESIAKAMAAGGNAASAIAGGGI